MERLSLHLQLFRFKWGKGERRRRLPVSCPCRRVRDDSLVLQHDGIQGAFCHCKGSYNSMRETRVFGNPFSRASVDVNLQLCQARHLWLQIGKKISTKKRAYGEVLWLVKRTQGHQAYYAKYARENFVNYKEVNPPDSNSLREFFNQTYTHSLWVLTPQQVFGG